MDNNKLTQAVALQYKTILTLYDSAMKQETDITDIRGNLDTINADTFSNKNNIDGVIGLIDKLTTATSNISERVTLLTEVVGKINVLNTEIIDKVNNHNKLFFIFANEIDTINAERKREKFFYLCDLCLIIGYITYVFWSKYVLRKQL
jgi:DNA integrity scanning protein DisA with diadenylate cyclase activity